MFCSVFAKHHYIFQKLHRSYSVKKEPGGILEKSCTEKVRKIVGKTHVPESLFLNKVAGSTPATL